MPPWLFTRPMFVLSLITRRESELVLTTRLIGFLTTRTLQQVDDA